MHLGSVAVAVNTAAGGNWLAGYHANFSRNIEKTVISSHSVDHFE